MRVLGGGKGIGQGRKKQRIHGYRQQCGECGGGGGGERVYGRQMVMEKNNKTKFKQIIK